MNLFIHRRDLRLMDNTTLLEQYTKEGKITPIFIFTPEQIEPSKNSYFSNNLVQFMIESIKELNEDYKKENGELYTFKGNYMDVIKNIQKEIGINSIAFNKDYSPYSKKRDEEIKNYCKKNNINFYSNEDMLLEPISTGKALSMDGDAYKVFTPFMENIKEKKEPDKPNKKKINNIETENKLKKIKYYFTNYDKLYKSNPNVYVKGGRKFAIKKLKNLKRFKNYGKCKDYFSYNTTLLSASINFNVVSIREVYYAIKEALGKNSGLIEELYWRDFYYYVLYFYPKVVGNSYSEKYDKIKWNNGWDENWDNWKKGKTGYPIVDACMRELNKTGYMPNRGRMIVSSFLIKHLWIDWKLGEKYFAQKLVDYNISANNGGWQWANGSGTSAQPYFRIFNPWTQIDKYDPDCKYIKKWIPELKNVPNEDIKDWENKYNKHINKGVKYFKPIVNHSKAREKALERYKKAFK